MINYISSAFRWFFKLEAASGLLLLISAICALIISNSNFSSSYFKILESYFFIGVNNIGIKLSLLHWINDALMAIFFFFVTLEIKREFINGELSNKKQALLPIIAAVGGMLVPALIYIYINIHNNDTLNGWAIPSATDIAFSLGVLSLLGSRVPISLKVFLTALAIIDDLGAIIIIAFFYTGDLSIKYLSLLLITFIFLVFLNKFNVKKFIPYLFFGLILWFFTHESGIHATIAGVLLACSIPHRRKENDFSLLIKIEHAISPYVAFFIMPLFAFANAGVSLNGLSFSSLLLPVPLGILLGLFIARKLAQKRNISKETITDYFLYLIPASIIGARLWAVTLNYQNYNFLEIFATSVKLILTLDPLLFDIIILSLKVSFSALIISSFFAIIIGYFLALNKFYLKNIIIIFFNSLMGIPPVVVGLIVYFLLARGGPLGVLQLLYTPSAMIIAQSIIIFPIVVSLSYEIFSQQWLQFKDHFRAFNIPLIGTMLTLIRHSFVVLITILLTGFGRAISEVGAVMIVGGNIEHYTRMMTTAIALETRMGNLEYAMALGIVLILLTMLVNSIVYLFNIKYR